MDIQEFINNCMMEPIVLYCNNIRIETLVDKITYDPANPANPANTVMELELVSKGISDNSIFLKNYNTSNISANECNRNDVYNYDNSYILFRDNKIGCHVNNITISVSNEYLGTTLRDNNFMFLPVSLEKICTAEVYMHMESVLNSEIIKEEIEEIEIQEISRFELMDLD